MGICLYLFGNTHTSSQIEIHTFEHYSQKYNYTHHKYTYFSIGITKLGQLYRIKYVYVVYTSWIPL